MKIQFVIKFFCVVLFFMFFLSSYILFNKGYVSITYSINSTKTTDIYRGSSSRYSRYSRRNFYHCLEHEFKRADLVVFDCDDTPLAYGRACIADYVENFDKELKKISSPNIEKKWISFRNIEADEILKSGSGSSMANAYLHFLLGRNAVRKCTLLHKVSPECC